MTRVGRGLGADKSFQADIVQRALLWRVNGTTGFRGRMSHVTSVGSRLPVPLRRKSFAVHAFVFRNLSEYLVF